MFKQVGLLIGVGVLLSGVVFTAMGINAYREVGEGLAAEKLNVPNPAILLTYPNAEAPEGVEVPLVLVDSASEAMAEATVIQTHTLHATGGLTYSEMKRDDPNRDLYLKAVTLRTALMQARMAFDLALFVTGIGMLISVAGLGILAVTYRK